MKAPKAYINVFWGRKEIFEILQPLGISESRATIIYRELKKRYQQMLNDGHEINSGTRRIPSLMVKEYLKKAVFVDLDEIYQKEEGREED